MQNIYEYEKNTMTFEVLKSLHFMISHGFYQTHKEIKSHLDPLIILLDGTDDIYQDDEEEV